MKNFWRLLMLKYHNINGLEGKISSNLIDMYKLNYKNYLLASIIAGFHRSYGLRNEGILMSLEIVNNIDDDTDNIQDRCLLVWNLYSLIDEFVDEEKFDEAMKLACRAEENWSRDIILGDDMGVYHVSWIEQIWQKKAEIYHLIGEKNNFNIFSDKILSSRVCLYDKAEEITGESILFDRCTYCCLELKAFEARKYDIQKAIKHIEEAILIKGGMKDLPTNIQVKSDKENSTSNLYSQFSKCLKYFYSLNQQSYDNIIYTYCKSCKNFNCGHICEVMNIFPSEYNCCSNYINKLL
jgi:hypothetical protein